MREGIRGEQASLDSPREPPRRAVRDSVTVRDLFPIAPINLIMAFPLDRKCGVRLVFNGIPVQRGRRFAATRPMMQKDFGAIREGRKCPRAIHG